jgi:hypothetical protein
LGVRRTPLLRGLEGDARDAGGAVLGGRCARAGGARWHGGHRVQFAKIGRGDLQNSAVIWRLLEKTVVDQRGAEWGKATLTRAPSLDF